MQPDQTHDPLVSVITIFRDAERFIREAIESVLAQTLADWELLLVDDGSRDRSSAIARSAADSDRRIRYLMHSDGGNHGMSASRNLGIRNARGKFLGLLDADDVYLPEKLERQVDSLEAEPRAALVYGPSLVWYSWTGRPDDLGRDHPRKLGVEPGTLVEPPTMLQRLLERKAWPPATCSLLIRRAAVEDVGAFEDSFTGMFEDAAFFAKVFLRHTALVEGDAWDRCRQHPDSCTQRALRAGTWRGRGSSASHEVLVRWLERYLRDHQIDDPRIWTPLRAMLVPYDHPIRYGLTNAARRLRAGWARGAARLRPGS